MDPFTTKFADKLLGLGLFEVLMQPFVTIDGKRTAS